jgi:hypothetical protein
VIAPLQGGGDAESVGVVIEGVEAYANGSDLLQAAQGDDRNARNLLLREERGGEAIVAGVEVRELLRGLMVLLVSEAVVELEKEGGRDGPCVADAEEVADESLVGGVRSEGIVEEAVLVVIIDVACTANEGPLAG